MKVRRQWPWINWSRSVEGGEENGDIGNECDSGGVSELEIAVYSDREGKDDGVAEVKFFEIAEG